MKASGAMKSAEPGATNAGLELLSDALSLAECSAEAHIFTRAMAPFVITHVNDAWISLCGFSREEAVGQTCRILQGPETCGDALAVLHKAIAAQTPITVRLLNYTKKGVSFLNQLSLRPLCDQPDVLEATHYVGTLRAWKQPEHTIGGPQALQTPEEAARNSNVLARMPASLEAALANLDAPQIITEASPPFRIVHVNPTWCHTCGYTADEVIGQTCKFLQGPATCEATTKALGAAALAQRPLSVKLVNYTKVCLIAM